MNRLIVSLLFASLMTGIAKSDKPIQFNVWPDIAPGETTKETGTPLPGRPTDSPPITRVEQITQPTLDVYPAKKPNGVAVLILPGGGFRYVVPDLEGSEAARWLNELGISAFVLRYRTATEGDERWRRPLQDSQRAMRLIRSEAANWKLDKNRIGLFGFSAGGQVAAIHLTSDDSSYVASDAIDEQSANPDFGILVYPWRIYDDESGGLMSPINITSKTPPSFIVHTDDDRSTALGAAMFYAGLKKNKVSGELHIYQNGGHGYGTRSRPKSVIGTWKDRGTDWLRIRGLTND